MPPGEPEDRLNDYARALVAFEAFAARRGRGDGESEEEFLRAHADLREPLVAMIEGDRLATRIDETLDARPAPLAWRGLPGEGEDFGVYRVVRTLGHGGMGAVFLAEHRELGRQVALKLIRPERLFADRARERFWREAVAISKLDHPGICPVYDVGEVEGIPFMTMRFIEGSSLASMISTTAVSSMSLPTTRKEIFALVQVFEEIALGLHHAHEQGIIHRDIKPGNIMIDVEGRAMILDFGLARAESGDEPALTMTGDVAGTPLYMAPEQVAPKGRQLNRTTDVYALGATLYECLTLRPMVEGESTQELFDFILTRDPVSASRINHAVPRDLAVVIEKATDKDPQRRYATALELAEDLRRVRSYETVLARRAGPVLRLRRWAQRRPWAASFVALLTVALAGSGFLMIETERVQSELLLAESVPLLREAVESEVKLHAAWPANLQAMAEWRENYAEPMQRRLVAAKQSLASMGVASPSATADGDADLEHRTTVLVGDLEAFLGPDGPDERIQRLQRERVANDRVVAEHAGAWDRAIAAIADHARYRGLRLKPQVGLIPLGDSPQSGLWEFWHVPSGAAPERDQQGVLTVAEATGLVFVLIPPGEFYMGSQESDPALPNHDQLARGNEQPVSEVSLSAFLVSKYEMTQGQWKRLTAGDLPSGFCAGKATKKLKYPFTLAHPIEKVSWDRCAQVLAWYGLDLPTEAQWEYACRAGTSTPWWVGGQREDFLDPDSGKGLLNIADHTASLEASWSEIQAWPTLDDGFSFLAPVDSYLPNAFGLYQVHGNVSEWCRDWYGGYDLPVAEGDGLRDSENTHGRVVRGGSWDKTTEHARSAYRGTSSGPTSTVGLRPSREIYD